MDLPSLDLITLFLKLLPGFLAAAVFHALTPYPKRDVADRIIAALIFTLFAELAVAMIRPILFWIGDHVVSLGQWSDDLQLGWAAAFGVLLGITWAYAVNNGCTHSIMQKWGVTKKTSLPTQWFSAFSKMERYIILHLKDGRRLTGWPLEWPDEPDIGHFVLQWPGWVLDDGSMADMVQIEAMLVRTDDVNMVEFLRFKDDPELKKNEQAIRSAKDALAKTRKETTNE